MPVSPRTPCLPVLLLLLAASRPWPGGPGAQSARHDPPTSRELRGGLLRLLGRLRANQSREDSNPEPVVRGLTPRPRPLPRIPLPSLTPQRALRRGRSLRGPRPGAPRTRGRRGAHEPPRDPCPLGPGRCCRLHTVTASLQDLGWADWVLSPRQLHVAVCAGECPPLYRAASTHAQVRARLHGLRPPRVPAPCCVPSSFAPVVLLQKTDAGVSLRTYDDLTARACHCA